MVATHRLITTSASSYRNFVIARRYIGPAVRRRHLDHRLKEVWNHGRGLTRRASQHRDRKRGAEKIKVACVVACDVIRAEAEATRTTPIGPTWARATLSNPDSAASQMVMAVLAQNRATRRRSPVRRRCRHQTR